MDELITLSTDQGWPAWMQQHLDQVDPNTTLDQDAAGCSDIDEEDDQAPERVPLGCITLASPEPQVDDAFCNGKFQLNDMGEI